MFANRTSPSWTITSPSSPLITPPPSYNGTYGCAAWPKPGKPNPAIAWSSGTRHLIKGTPARYLGLIHAPHEKAAIEEAAKEFRVPDNPRDRIAVMRDDW